MSNHSPQSATASSLNEQDLLASYAEQFGVSLIRNFQKRGAQKATAEDLAQEVFLRLAKRVSGGEIENAQAYLMQTASSVWNDHLRKRQSQRHYDHFEYAENDDSDKNYPYAPVGFSPKRVLEGKEAVKQIVDLLNELPERTRTIYLLCRVEGFKRKEVAERFSMTISGVDKHLITATDKITKHFSRDDE